MPTLPAFLIVARIVAPFGVRGEVKADILTDFPDRLANRDTVYLGREDETPRSYAIRGVRFHQKQALLTLAGVEDRTCAESLRGLFVQIPTADTPPLPDGAYYYHQIIGLTVYDSSGVCYGTVTSIMTTASNDVYVVDGERGRLYVPAMPDFVRQVDLDNGRLIVDVASL